MILSKRIRDEYCSKYLEQGSPIDHCIGCPYWKFSGTTKRCQAPKEPACKVFIMNYAEMKDILGHDSGVIMDNLRLGLADYQADGAITVQYGEQEYACFRTHSVEGDWTRVEFIGVC